MQYRDMEGRERREETSAMGAIFITDPVARLRYTLHPESQVAEKGPLVVKFWWASPEAGNLGSSDGGWTWPGNRGGICGGPGRPCHRTSSTP